MNTSINAQITLIPDVATSAFVISLESARVINYAAVQNDIPVVRRLLIQNNSDLVFRNVELVVTANPLFFEPRRFVFDTFGAGESRSFSSVQLSLALNHEYLFGLNESEAGQIKISVHASDGKLLTESQPVRQSLKNKMTCLLSLSKHKIQS